SLRITEVVIVSPGLSESELILEFLKSVRRKCHPSASLRITEVVIVSPGLSESEQIIKKTFEKLY
ncbi:MAG: hypothetical protein LC124_15350, partial [Ignavibacteriales bacterium]|nr:hypothetical protein [Ignavibacteriales bacterium]